MILALIIGLVMTSGCLAFQALTAVIAFRYFLVASTKTEGRNESRTIFRAISNLMMLLMAGIIVQMVAWSLLYLLLGLFPDFETALYFSGVVFTSLGFGDLTIKGTARLLSPLEAASGVMMLGISTALFIAAVEHVTEQRRLEKHVEAEEASPP